MRFRLSFFTKLSAIVGLFLCGVLLMTFRLDKEQRAAASLARRDDQIDVVDDRGTDFDTGKEDYHQPAQKPRKNIIDDNPENPVRAKFGQPRTKPTAVLKQGVLGNFEPHYVHKEGPGEDGVAFHLPASKREEGRRSVQEYGFNVETSNMIAMDRNVPDVRPDECKYWHYDVDLPTVSVIVAFHNEGFSTLMRTIHSIKNTSPPKYLKEIVMVDDFSDKPDLGEKLETYLKENFGDLVKLYRNTKREGLINTRTLGAKYSTAEVILFLDAHCECNRNWLVPLLARIAYDPTIMVVPIVDGIDHDTWAYRPVYQQGVLYQGIFEWGFLYKETEVPEKELARRKYDSEPYRAPTHAGGLFAMNREFFFMLGAYDPGLQIWGGENFELSFKIWQCGGSIEWVPCSHVGHVYRTHMPYSLGSVDHKIPIINVNYMRVVEVWLDPEYREYFYTRQPDMRGYPIGDLSAQLALKKNLQCKPFKYFMEEVAYAVLEKFPPLPKNIAWGEVIFKDGSTNYCWDKGHHDTGTTLSLSGCHHQGGNQMFRFNAQGQIATGERCVVSVGETLKVVVCPTEPSGDFQYEPTTRMVRHRAMNRCVEGEGIGKELRLRACNPDEPRQQWKIKEIYSWK